MARLIGSIGLFVSLAMLSGTAHAQEMRRSPSSQNTQSLDDIQGSWYGLTICSDFHIWSVKMDVYRAQDTLEAVFDTEEYHPIEGRESSQKILDGRVSLHSTGYPKIVEFKSDEGFYAPYYWTGMHYPSLGKLTFFEYRKRRPTCSPLTLFRQEADAQRSLDVVLARRSDLTNNRTRLPYRMLGSYGNYEVISSTEVPLLENALKADMNYRFSSNLEVYGSPREFGFYLSSDFENFQADILEKSDNRQLLAERSRKIANPENGVSYIFTDMDRRFEGHNEVYVLDHVEQKYREVKLVIPSEHFEAWSSGRDKRLRSLIFNSFNLWSGAGFYSPKLKVDIYTRSADSVSKESGYWAFYNGGNYLAVPDDILDQSGGSELIGQPYGLGALLLTNGRVEALKLATYPVQELAPLYYYFAFAYANECKAQIRSWDTVRITSATKHTQGLTSYLPMFPPKTFRWNWGQCNTW